MSFRTEVKALRIQTNTDGSQQLQIFPDPEWYPAKDCSACQGWGYFRQDTAHGDRGEMCPVCEGMGAVKKNG